ncbi:MAG: hypothetical protein QXO75_11915 [Nitrososphaerota archaeon]
MSWQKVLSLWHQLKSEEPEKNQNSMKELDRNTAKAAELDKRRKGPEEP